jgi:hypothetical protein
MSVSHHNKTAAPVNTEAAVFNSKSPRPKGRFDYQLLRFRLRLLL